MKRRYWSLLKSCWLESGWGGRSIMVHQWMHPDEITVRYNNSLYVHKEKKKELQPPISSNLPLYQLEKHISFHQTESLLVTAPKTWFQNMKDAIKITQDEPTVSLFFNFTLLLRESQRQGPAGPGSKLVLCAEQSTVKHDAWGLIQAYSGEMTPSSLCQCNEIKMKSSTPQHVIIWDSGVMGKIWWEIPTGNKDHLYQVSKPAAEIL